MVDASRTSSRASAYLKPACKQVLTSPVFKQRRVLSRENNPLLTQPPFLCFPTLWQTPSAGFHAPWRIFSLSIGSFIHQLSAFQKSPFFRFQKRVFFFFFATIVRFPNLPPKAVPYAEASLPSTLRLGKHPRNPGKVRGCSRDTKDAFYLPPFRCIAFFFTLFLSSRASPLFPRGFRPIL